jgi:glycosyltransferase involved in cell wall biosynthesis
VNKKLSIITINYNNLNGLHRTVESVVNQTWQEFEYIIIDGGSTDGSAEYLESQATNFDYWISEPDTGIYNAMNKGIQKATGEYLLFLNSGDHLFSSTVLLENHEFLKEKDLLYFNIEVVECAQISIKSYPDTLTFHYFTTHSLPHPATFTRATVFNQVGLYDEELKIASDWKFSILSICKFGCTYAKIDKTMSVFYLDGQSSIPENVDLIYKERKKVLEDEFALFVTDALEITYLRDIVCNLRKSRKIKWLIKLGLIDSF